jgi:RNA polymerase sigma factor (TIGR02999 family)
MGETFDAETVSGMIHRVNAGDRSAFDDLFTALYQELRRLAQGFMKDERAGHTLHATALVHEAYGRMANAQNLSIEDRRHFFKLAAKVIRQVLLDHARGRGREKRGGSVEHVTLDSGQLAGPPGSVDVEALHVAIEQLAKLSPRQAQVVEWKFFAGMTSEDVAALLGTSLRTIEGDWAMARVWLRERLAHGRPSE